MVEDAVLSCVAFEGVPWRFFVVNSLSPLHVREGDLLNSVWDTSLVATFR